MTSNRWWAPSGPHIGLDDFDHDMLQPSGQQPRLDLGASLFAAHRVGAAALEEAARTPLVDSRVVIQKLADARARLGIPLSEAVSKSVEGRSYAMVLVRDLLDDADMAAHDLFRAAVAKGVAPSQAASRAGAIYGADARALNRYRVLACDPRAQPHALIEAGDRALFDFVEKVVSEETDERELVSKAPAAEMERPSSRIATAPGGEEYYDVRDPSGRFAHIGQPSVLARMRERFGIGGQQAPEVATGPPSETMAQQQQQKPAEQPPQPPKAKSMAEIRARRERREQMTARRAGPEAARPKTAPKVAPATAAKPKTERAKIGRGKVKLTPKQRQQLTRISEHGSIARNKETAKPQHALKHHPFLRPLPDSDTNYRTLDGMTLVASEGQARAFISRAGSSPERIVRIGHLQSALNNRPAVKAGDGEHADQLDEIGNQADGQQPDHIFVSAEELDAEKDVPLESGGKSRMEIEANRLSGGNPYVDEMVTEIPDYNDDGMWVISEHANRGNSPTVFEFEIKGAEGRAEARDVDGRGLAWKLDPNQAYKVEAPLQWRSSYRDGVIVTKVALTPVSEREVFIAQGGVVKDTAVLERPRRIIRDYATPAMLRQQPGMQMSPGGEAYYDVRDQDGKFTASPTSSSRPPEAQQRRKLSPMQRRALIERRRGGADAAVARRSGPAPAEQKAPERGPQQRQRAERAQLSLPQKIRARQTRSQVKQVIAERTRELPPERRTVIKPGTAYAVLPNELSSYLVQKVREQMHGELPTTPREMRDIPPTLADVVFPMTGYRALELQKQRTSSQDVAGSAAASFQAAYDGPNGGQRMKELGRVSAGDDEESGGVQGIVDAFLGQEDISMVVVEPPEEDGVSRITCNAVPASPVVIVEFDPQVNSLSDDYDLHFSRVSELGHDQMHEDGEIVGYTIPVYQFIAKPAFE